MSMGEDLKNRFTYHPPREGQMVMYTMLRQDALEFAKVIEALCPDSREKSLAITKLEEAVMWANAAIARNEIIVRFTEMKEAFKEVRDPQFPPQTEVYSDGEK